MTAAGGPPGAPARRRPGRSMILNGLRPYDKQWLTNDVLAGVTLAALAIPEVMGYTKIAGMPVITGLYTIVVPIVAFALLGSSRHLVVGADSATAAIMFAGISGLGVAGLQPGSKQWVALAGVSALLAGAFLLLARVARLGFLANFLSRTVLVGFLTGVGIQVALGQFAGMLGVASPSGSVNEFSGTIRKFIDTMKELSDTSIATLAVSIGVLVILIVFSKWIKRVPGGLVAVIGAIWLSWAFDWAAHGVAILGPVPSGLPSVGLPTGVTWTEATGLITVAVSMFVVILAQSAATSRAYAVRYGEKFDENEDLVGLGLANLAAGLTGTFVVNGSPTKTEMVDEAKSRTQVAQLTTAVVVAVVLVFLTEPLQYLPEAVLSAVVFLIGVKLIAIGGMREIWRLRRDEFWVAAATAVVVVIVGVEQGILLAILLSIILHVRRHYSPPTSVLKQDADGDIERLPATPGTDSVPGLIVYQFGAGIFYANASNLSQDILNLVDVANPPRWFVLYADSIDDIDFTGAKTVSEMADLLAKRGITFAFSDVNDDVRRELDRFGITDKIGADHIFDSAHDAVEAFHAST